MTTLRTKRLESWFKERRMGGSVTRCGFVVGVPKWTVPKWKVPKWTVPKWKVPKWEVLTKSSGSYSEEEWVSGSGVVIDWQPEKM